MSSPLIKTLSVLRMIIGSSSLLLPRQIGPVFGVPISPDGTIIARLLGIREFVLGAYLWKANRDRNTLLAQGTGNGISKNNGTAQERLLKPKPSSIATSQASPSISTSSGGPNTRINDMQTMEIIHRSKLTIALWLGVIVDCVDVFSCIACILEGNLSDLAKVSFGVGAVAFAAIGAQQLRILAKEEE